MQNKPKIILIVAVIAILIIGIIWYKKPKEEEVVNTSTGGQEQNQEQIIQESTTTPSENITPKKLETKAKISGWKTFSSEIHRVRFLYPSSWIVKESYLNVSADILVSALNGWTTDAAGRFKMNSIDEMATLEILARNFENFGKNPMTKKTTIDGQEARIILSQGGGTLKGAIIVKYPKPIFVYSVANYYFMIKFYHSENINEIRDTIKFTL